MLEPERTRPAAPHAAEDVRAEAGARATRLPGRRHLASLLGALPVLGACGGRGGIGGGPYHHGPVSDHFDGARFSNPGGEGPRGFAQLLRWQLGERGEPWPASFPSPTSATGRRAAWKAPASGSASWATPPS